MAKKNKSINFQQNYVSHVTAETGRKLQTYGYDWFFYYFQQPNY